MPQHLVKPATCPGCLEQLSGATNASGSQSPNPGDPTICGYCATWCFFQEDLTLRAATPQERDALLRLPAARRAEKVARMVLSQRKNERPVS